MFYLKGKIFFSGATFCFDNSSRLFEKNNVRLFIMEALGNKWHTNICYLLKSSLRLNHKSLTILIPTFYGSALIKHYSIINYLIFTRN